MTELRELTTAKPVGMLYSQGREYFLLDPLPLLPAEWQTKGTDRFLVVPNVDLYDDEMSGYKPAARHIVTNAYCIDYMWDRMPEITLVKSAMLDVPEDDETYINSQLDLDKETEFIMEIEAELS